MTEECCISFLPFGSSLYIILAFPLSVIDSIPKAAVAVSTVLEDEFRLSCIEICYDARIIAGKIAKCVPEEALRRCVFIVHSIASK